MNSNRCSQCGREVEELDGLCPSCLVQQGLREQPAGDPLRDALQAKVGAQYRILRLLGRGGMGAVYLARDLTLEREVAIKVVNSAADSAEMYDRFRREAKTAAQLAHPHIVPLHAFGNVEGMPYFVMGYVRGESLAERLRRDGKLPEVEARRILAEIADALDHAHRRGVVHRDVKPDNILIEDASGRALLTDFGIAKSITHGETLTQHGSIVGTPHYMSPEQGAGHADIDGRSDIYSLGVVGYTMLAGRLPFEGRSAADILAKHVTQEPPPLRSIAPTISDTTQHAVERCLAKDPAKRWPDARALRVALGTADDADLPDALEAVHGHGVAFVMIATVLLLLSWIVIVRMQDAPPVVLAIIGGIIALGYVVVVASLRFEGFPLAVVQRVIWSEPSWWPSWYPRKLRRRNNVWDRLPRSVRWFRVVFPFVFVSLAMTVPDPMHNFTLKLLVFLIVFAIAGALELTAKRELKRMGITSWNDLSRIVSTPPSRVRFWSQPRIAAVLAPAQDDALTADSPHAQLQSILRIAEDLSGPLRSIGSDAAAAGRRLLASIDQSDKQIADLARNVEAGEEQRLVEKIAALANVEQGAEMRQLLEKQLDLIRDLSARIENARARRNRHIEMLKTLALHMASLRARVSPSDVGSLSDNVRVLCEQISRQGNTNAFADEPTVRQSTGA